MHPVIEKIQAQIAAHPVLLYMKGNKHFPMCGFSGRVVDALMRLGVDFETVNVLENPDIRQQLPLYAQWPTFPQLYVQGELVGGCDIVCAMFESGELETLLRSHHLLAD